jgi:hypothetical protein
MTLGLVLVPTALGTPMAVSVLDSRYQYAIHDNVPPVYPSHARAAGRRAVAAATIPANFILVTN